MSTSPNVGTSRRDDTKCANCDELLRNMKGRKKIIDNEAESKDYTERIGKIVRPGDTLCSRCRLKGYDKVSKNQQNSSQSSSALPESMQSQEPTQYGAEHHEAECDLSLHALEKKTSSISLQSSDAIESSQSSATVSCLQSSGDDPSFIVKFNVDDAETVEMPFQRVIVTHGYCFLCSASTNIITVPCEARLQVFQRKRIFIPKGNRCCLKHMIKKRFFEDKLDNLKIHSNNSTVEVSDLTAYLSELSTKCDHELKDKIGDGFLSDERLKVLTGFTWDNLNKLCSMLISMRNSTVRTVLQALVVFLFKLRSGNSNNVVASVLGLSCEQQVSDFCDEVMNSFDKDVLPKRFGYFSFSRDKLIENETSEIARKLYNINDQLVLIFDGTYIRHEKSTNNNYQRKSYSGQKKAPLCKPFTICTTNGYIVEMEGPFYASQNDADIMKIRLNKPNGLREILKPGDICVVDRGFRDVVSQLEELGYVVLMPALKGKRAQLSTEESNHSRWVTKIRWVVEAVHGFLGKKYQLLHQTLDNKLLPKIRLFRIACFLNKTFGKRMNADLGIADEIITQMKSRRSVENSLAQEAEIQRWNRRKTQFQLMTSADLLDFPEMTEKYLKILFTGSYQLSQAVSYVAEMMDDSGNITL